MRQLEKEEQTSRKAITD